MTDFRACVQPLVNRNTGDTPSECKGLVELKDLSFAYPTRPTSSVIDEMNLVLNPVPLPAHTAVPNRKTF